MKSEVKAWDLRQRVREEEVGPQFRFQSRLQIERLQDTCSKDTSMNFEAVELTNASLKAHLKNYYKSGETQKQASYQPPNNRLSHLGNNVHFSPKALLSTLH